MTMWKDAILSEGYVKKMKISYGVASTVVWIAFVGISILSYKIGYQPGYVIALILAAMGLILDLRISVFVLHPDTATTATTTHIMNTLFMSPSSSDLNN